LSGSGAIVALARRIAFLLTVAVLAMGALQAPAALAQGAVVPAPSSSLSSPAAEAGVPDKVRAWLDLMADPQVRAWLQAQMTAPAGGTASAAPVPPVAAAPPDGGEAAAEASASGRMSARIEAVRERVALLVGALPTLPSEIGMAAERFRGKFVRASPVALFILVGVFALAGVLFSLLVMRWLAPARAAHLAHDPENGLSRARHHLVRFVHRIIGVAAFALGAFGGLVFLALPPVLNAIVVALLIAALATRAVSALGQFLLLPPGPMQAPRPERLRLLPVDDAGATFWQRRLTAFASFFAFGYALVDILAHLALPRPVLLLTAFGLGLGLLAIAIETTLRRPPRGRQRTIFDWLVVAYLVLLWAMWVVGGNAAFWVLLYVGFLPKAVQLAGEIARRITHRPLEPPAEAALPSTDGDAPSGETAGEASEAVTVTQVQTSVGAVIVERGARAALLVLAALWLARMLGLDFEGLSARDDLGMRLARGAISAIVIFFIADFVWHLARALIDRQLAQSIVAGDIAPEEAARRGRLRTLLPILRNVVWAVVAVTAILMILSSMGIEIGPLIAGAGVVGVAVGFGSQTLVRDILSGVFYMLDDAFRVGEYIQSGTYRGTVESFSLRSVKLRHHRGPVFTVPFGQLGAVQNMSRDWVIDKFMVRVEYDTDVAKVKKLIKGIGKELQENPEFGPNIIETLKMQGVEAFGEFAIELRFKMKTKPGEQFTIRRHAFSLIKKAFEENGINFALPTVHVAGGSKEAAEPAAAKAALDLVMPQPAAAAAS
jgi:small-conductance mechanosensitive channel